MRVLGVDVAGRHGWVGVVLDDRGYAGADLDDSLGALIARLEPLDAIAVDIPIGNLAWGGRAVDGAARALLGARSSTIFNAPPTEVLELATYEEANAALAARGLPKLSKQSWGLRHRMLDAAEAAEHDDRIHEVGPELCFAAMNGGAPIAERKKSWAGARHRIDLLHAEGIELPADLGRAGAVPVDDALDAAACAWTARRIATGEAIIVPDPETTIELDPRTSRRLEIHV